MEQALSVNVKGMTTALNLLLQISPPNAWGESLHVSGLFGFIVKTLVDDKARIFHLLLFNNLIVHPGHDGATYGTCLLVVTHRYHEQTALLTADVRYLIYSEYS